MADRRPDGPHLRGQLFLARQEYVTQLLGAVGWAQVLARLSEAERARLVSLDRTGWYPFGLLVHLDRAIQATLAPDDPDLFERLGAASAEMRNHWIGEHASLLNVHAFLARVADEHADFHTFGEGHYRKIGFGEGELAFGGYPEVDETYCLGARGYLRRAVEMITTGPVRVLEPECQRRGQPACIFRIRWQA